MRKSLAVALPLLTAVIAAAASCSKPPPPVTPTPTLDAGASPVDASAGLVAVPDAAPAPVATAPVFFTADAGPAPASGPPVLTEQALDAAIDLAITAAAPKVAPKMQKEGQPSRATLKEGDHFPMLVTLQPNRCYTIVGFSPAGNVAQLDVKLFALPLNIEAGKSAASDKAMPVMGKGGAAICPILPVAVPYKVDAVATKGAGRIGIHVFSRDK